MQCWRQVGLLSTPLVNTVRRVPASGSGSLLYSTKNAGDYVKEKYEEVKEKASEAVEKIKETVGGKTAEANKEAQDMMGNMVDKTRNMKEDLKNKAQNMKEGIEQKTENMKDGADDHTQELCEKMSK